MGQSGLRRSSVRRRKVAHYSVQVNGHTVAVESAAYQGNTHTVWLSLPEGSLQSGDRLVVAWDNLADEHHQSWLEAEMALTAH